MEAVEQDGLVDDGIRLWDLDESFACAICRRSFLPEGANDRLLRHGDIGPLVFIDSDHFDPTHRQSPAGSEHRASCL